MYIIGSRTGGYEYWVEMQCGFKIWLGQRPNSDKDILLEKGEQPPEGHFDIFYGTPKNSLNPNAPYIKDNRLICPKDHNYLIYPLCTKLYARNFRDVLIKNYLTVANIKDKNLEKVSEILLDYELIPNPTCNRFAYLGKRRLERLKKINKFSA
jgi:hypothetical protein